MAVLTGTIGHIGLSSGETERGKWYGFSFGRWRVDGGQIQVGRPMFMVRHEDEGPWPLEIERLKELLSTSWVLQVEAELIPDRNPELWTWTDVIGPVQDAELAPATGDGTLTKPPKKSAPGPEPVPEANQVDPFEVEGIGTMRPEYTKDFRVREYRSDPISIDAFEGVKIRVSASGQDDERLLLVPAALQNLANAGPALRQEAAPHMHQYYQSVRNDFGEEDCAEYGIPLQIDEKDIWDHVELKHCDVEVHVGSDSPNLHPDAVYFTFEGRCTWEDEHDIQLTVLNGERVVRVGPFTGHPTNAFARNDPAFLDVVFD